MSSSLSDAKNTMSMGIYLVTNPSTNNPKIILKVKENMHKASPLFKPRGNRISSQSCPLKTQSKKMKTNKK